MLVEKNVVRSMTTPDDVFAGVCEKEKQRLVMGELLDKVGRDWEQWVCVSVLVCRYDNAG